MKKTIALLLAALMMLALCACNDTKGSAPAEPAAGSSDTQVDVAENETVSESRFYKGVEIPDYVTDHQLAELDAIDQYIDNQKYLTGHGPKLDYVIDEVVVNNVCLKIGMSYDEVVAAGLTPTDEEFANTETDILAYTCQFVDPDGNLLRLGFIGDKGKTVADGVLYSVSREDDQELKMNSFGMINSESREDNTEFKVGPCVVPCSISDILDALGEPYDIDFGVYSDILDVQMKYLPQEQDVYLTFCVNLETEEVFDFTLEGYSD